MLRELQIDKFGRTSKQEFDPSALKGRAPILWTKIVKDVPFDAAPDLHGPVAGVMKEDKPAGLLKKDFRTQKIFFDHLKSRYADTKDAEGKKFYKSMANTIAGIMSSKTSQDNLKDEQLEQMVQFAFKVSPDGKIYGDDDAAKQILQQNPGAYKYMVKRYNSTHGG